MNSTISLSADDQSLFQNLRHAFSPSSVYGELLQNGRRAGATRIDITYDGDTLVVVDNGHGVDDLQNLLTKARSSWRTEVMAADKPFGLGFLSALYRAEHVAVSTLVEGSTCAQGFASRTDKILSGEPVATFPSAQAQAGTRIVLSGFVIDGGSSMSVEARISTVRRVLDECVAGFPIAITYNSIKLSRPEALTEWFTDSEVGSVRLDLAGQNLSLYLQGAPIADPYWRYRGRTVVHLNEHFQAKLPDRTELLNHADYGVIRAAIKVMGQKHLAQIKASMPPLDFLVAHAEHCQAWGAMELLNDVPYALGEWFTDWSETRPGHLRNGDRRTLSGSMSAEEVRRSGVVLMPEEDHSLAQSWAQQNGRLTLDLGIGLLHDDHWLKQIALDVVEDEFECAPTKDDRSMTVSLSVMDLKLSRAERIAIVHKPTGESACVGAALVPDSTSSWRQELIVTDVSEFWGAMLLLSSYEEDDRWLECEEADDVNALTVAYHEMCATTPSDLIAMRLRRSGPFVGQAGVFANQRFIVEFNENGQIASVMPEAA